MASSSSDSFVTAVIGALLLGIVLAVLIGVFVRAWGWAFA